MAMTPHVLVVAGTDSSGGAGLSRDVETIAAFGLRTSVAVTAVTVQTDEAVERIEQMPPDLIAAQMRAALAASPVAAIKIGMLGTTAAVEAVASVLASYPQVPLVLDPVLASTSGRALMDSDAIDALKRQLIPLCSLVTPNLHELALLSASPPALDEVEIIRQGQALIDAGATAVLVKGGHATGENSADILLRPDRAPMRFEAPRIAATMRGTGCMLASAISAHLACGETLESSVRDAKHYVLERLRASAPPRLER
ncbi:bifunctional hydroxymethylpyrimidine kinase/phosphomethylpyrimidine kinase [Mesorhizobium sp. ANAO-SY3R2]|uniref:bifunctional hydroxymethylpyrimidine kinase/phosphomethylpyrimidine kinase n=1 Tax=Mesorhizobium sp. ANAO-SY3R2 TaxID=3166644 RepID=UPI00367246E1